MSIWFSWAYYISGWIICIVMIPVVMRRGRPTVGMAWLLVIFFVPWVGLLLYLLMGESRLERRQIKRHRRGAEARRKLARLEMLSPHMVRPKIAPEHVGLVKLAEKLGENPIVGGNEVKLHSNTAETLDHMLSDIERAKHHVHMSYYIFEGEVAKRFADALARAVKRGVKCRVLADSVGSWALFSGLGPKMVEQGIELVEMLPVNPFRKRFARFDLRNHRKLMIVDGALAYTGSQNINDPLLGPTKRPWYEMTARVMGPVVIQLQTIFLEDWYFDTDQVPDTPDIFPGPFIAGEVPIQALPSGPTFETENYQRMAMAAINSAQERLIITSPYFVPDETMMVSLETAVMRGVEVTLIIPQTSDQRLTDIAGRAYYPSLLRRGVKLFLHTHGILHTKTMTIDDTFALVGSANFDIRSFYLNFELSLLIYGPEFTLGVRRVQQSYLDQSVQVTEDIWARRNPFVQIIDSCAQLFSPLL